MRLWKLETTENVVRWLAYALPRDVALWAFVRVCCATRQEPDAITYESAYKAWAAGAGR